MLLCSHSPNDVPPGTSAERIHSRGTGHRASVQGWGEGGGGGGGGEERKVYIVGPGHMTKMAAPLIYGKNLNDQADCLESWNVTYGTLVLQILYNLDRIYGKVKLGPLGF